MPVNVSIINIKYLESKNMFNKLRKILGIDVLEQRIEELENEKNVLLKEVIGLSAFIRNVTKNINNPEFIKYRCQKAGRKNQKEFPNLTQAASYYKLNCAEVIKAEASLSPFDSHFVVRDVTITRIVKE